MCCFFFHRSELGVVFELFALLANQLSLYATNGIVTLRRKYKKSGSKYILLKELSYSLCMKSTIF